MTLPLAVITLFSVLFAEKTIDHDIEELEKNLWAASGKEKIEILNQLAYRAYDQYPQKCITYGKQALKLAQKIKYKQGEGLALKHIGMGYMVLGNNDQALEYARNALKTFETMGDKKNAANTLTTMGIIYMNLGQHDASLKYYYQALKIAEGLGDKKEINNNLNNIGVLHFCQGNLDKALEYYFKSLRIEKELGNKKGMSECFNNIALVHHCNKKYNQAIEYYLKASKIDQGFGNKAGLASVDMNLGILYAELKEYKKSEEFLLKSLKFAEDIGSKYQIGQTSVNLGEIYSRQKKYEESLLYLRKSLDIAKEIKSKEITRVAYRNLSELYSETGEHRKALEYFKLYFEVNEEIFNEKTSKQVAEMQTRYETLKKEKEIEILKRDNKIQKLTRNAFIFSFVLVSIILVLLFRKYLYLFSFWKKEKYIGQFRLMEKIGSGGMGIIYRGHHLRDKSESIAVKVLREELCQDEDIIKRFKQEASIIDKLDHPHIVKIIERGQYKQKFFIAMEFFEGRTLNEKIAKEGQLDLKEAFHIMRQLADALTLIHSQNIIHRDLKPSNIMLINQDGDENVVKLLDFGVARMKFQTKMTRTGILVGTTSYLSPEQIKNKGISTASDIFSLGIIFYEMVTGKKPFTGNSDSSIIKEILGESPPEPIRTRADLPKHLNQLIMKMLAKQKKPRPTSAEILEVLKGVYSKNSRPNCTLIK